MSQTCTKTKLHHRQNGLDLYQTELHLRQNGTDLRQTELHLG